MHTNKSIPEPWLFFLRELDSAVREEVRLDCRGGFVISMVYGFRGQPQIWTYWRLRQGKQADPFWNWG